MIGKLIASLLPVLGLICLGSNLSAAEEATAAVAPAETVEQPIDVALLMNEHLVIVRIFVLRGNQSFLHEWQQFVEQQFDAADVDHDGQLDGKELKRVQSLLVQPTPNPQNKRTGYLIAGGRGGPVVNDPPLDSATAEGLNPGITRGKLVEFLLSSVHSPIRVEGQFQKNNASPALFAWLDADHDQRLSADECRRAFDALRPLDYDESEIFDPQQLLIAAPEEAAPSVGPVSAARAEVGRLGVKLLNLAGAGKAVPWTGQIREYFAVRGPGIKRMQSLPRATTLYDEETFESLDADGDGALDMDELAHLMRRPVPHVEMAVNLNRQALKQAATPVHLDSACRFDVASSPAALTIGAERLELGLGSLLDTNESSRVQSITTRFQQFDMDKNEYLEKAELERFGLANLMVADADGDGKIFLPELSAYLNFQGEAAAHRLVIRVVDHGHGLFEALDTNGDGRLGHRELNGLVARLAEWDRNDDRQLTLDEVSHRYTLRIEQETPQLAGGNSFISEGYRSIAAIGRSQPTAPAWFVQMDRNRDGDLSRREFLGTAAQFRQFDADGDQLIDAQEAARTPMANAPPAAAAQ